MENELPQRLATVRSFNLLEPFRRDTVAAARWPLWPSRWDTSLWHSQWINTQSYRNFRSNRNSAQTSYCSVCVTYRLMPGLRSRRCACTAKTTAACVARTLVARPWSSACESSFNTLRTVTQICVFTLQLCKTDDANLRF